jgi:hypothetical protein
MLDLTLLILDFKNFPFLKMNKAYIPIPNTSGLSILNSNDIISASGQYLIPPNSGIALTLTGSGGGGGAIFDIASQTSAGGGGGGGSGDMTTVPIPAFATYMLLNIIVGVGGTAGIGGVAGIATSGGDGSSTTVQVFNFDVTTQQATTLYQTYTVLGGSGGQVGINYLNGGNGGIGGAEPSPLINGENEYNISAGKSLYGGDGYMTQTTGARGRILTGPSRTVGGGGGGGGGSSTARAEALHCYHQYQQQDQVEVVLVEVV